MSGNINATIVFIVNTLRKKNISENEVELPGCLHACVKNLWEREEGICGNFSE